MGRTVHRSRGNKCIFLANEDLEECDKEGYRWIMKKKVGGTGDSHAIELASNVLCPPIGRAEVCTFWGLSIAPRIAVTKHQRSPTTSE